MSGKERILSTIHRRPSDRVLVAPFIHTNFVHAFYDTRDLDVISKTIEVYEHFGFDIIHRNCTPTRDHIGPSADEWQVERTVEKDGRDETTTTVIRTPKGDLTETHQVIWVTEYDAEASAVDYLIKSEDDLDRLMAYQPAIGTIDTSCITSARRALGDKGLTAPWVQGAFNEVAYYYRRLDHLLLDPIDNPTFYHRMMEYFLDRNLQLISQYIDAGAHLVSVGGNVASGKVVSESYFREHVFPYEKRLIDYIQQRNVPVIYHNCGYARRLFSSLRDLGMKVYESLTPPPYGDTTLEEAFDGLGPDIVLHGGVDQIGFLMTAKPDDVRQKVESMLELAKRRGNYILGTSDYFDEHTPHENVAALAQAGHDYGRY